jgi:hypothetical protein
MPGARGAIAVLIAASTIAGGVAAARADEPAGACAQSLADPVGLPWRTSGLDAGRGACRRPGVGVELDGHALIDTPAFYGTLAAGATIRARLVGGPIEWTVAARAPTVTFVQNAVLAATGLGYGPLAVGAALGTDTRWRCRPLRLALAATIELPYSERRLASRRAAGSLAALASWRITDGWRLHARVALLGERSWSAIDAGGRGAGALSADVARRLARRLFVGAGVDAQLGWHGAGLDHLALRVDGRLRLAGRWRATLAIGLPVAGAERTDLAFVLGVTRDR